MELFSTNNTDTKRDSPLDHTQISFLSPPVTDKKAFREIAHPRKFTRNRKASLSFDSEVVKMVDFVDKFEKKKKNSELLVPESRNNIELPKAKTRNPRNQKSAISSTSKNVPVVHKKIKGLNQSFISYHKNKEGQHIMPPKTMQNLLLSKIGVSKYMYKRKSISI